MQHHPSKATLPIHTKRLTIRPLEPSDLDAMHAVYSDSEATKYIPGGARDIFGTRQRLADLIDHHERHSVSKWAVTLTDTGQLIGDCGLQFLPGRPELELGFHFAREFWGRGYATEAASACLTWAKANRSEQILAVIDPEHVVSQHLLTNIGFKPIGHEYLIDRTWLVYVAQ